MLKRLANRVIDRIQSAFPPNRIAVLLTPVFAAAAGYAATWTADHLPGIPPMDPNWLAGIFVTGAVGAIAAAYKWIDGWQGHEAREGNLKLLEAQAQAQRDAQAQARAQAPAGRPVPMRTGGKKR